MFSKGVGRAHKMLHLRFKINGIVADCYLIGLQCNVASYDIHVRNHNHHPHIRPTAGHRLPVNIRGLGTEEMARCNFKTRHHYTTPYMTWRETGNLSRKNGRNALGLATVLVILKYLERYYIYNFYIYKIACHSIVKLELLITIWAHILL